MYLASLYLPRPRLTPEVKFCDRVYNVYRRRSLTRGATFYVYARRTHHSFALSVIYLRNVTSCVALYLPLCPAVVPPIVWRPINYAEARETASGSLATRKGQFESGVREEKKFISGEPFFAVV